MPTTASTPSGKATTRSTTSRKTKNDAIELLIGDHNKVKKMFKEFKKLASAAFWQKINPVTMRNI